MRISEAAMRAGTSARMLRYYEQEGLLAPGRDPNGYRDYADEDVTAARRIVALSTAGLTLASIRVILPCAVGDGPSLHLVACPWIAPELRKQLDGIRAQIRDLSESAESVERYLRTMELMALQAGSPEAASTASGA